MQSHCSQTVPGGAPSHAGAGPHRQLRSSRHTNRPWSGSAGVACTANCLQALPGSWPHAMQLGVQPDTEAGGSGVIGLLPPIRYPRGPTSHLFKQSLKGSLWPLKHKQQGGVTSMCKPFRATALHATVSGDILDEGQGFLYEVENGCCRLCGSYDLCHSYYMAACAGSARLGPRLPAGVLGESLCSRAHAALLGTQCGWEAGLQGRGCGTAGHSGPTRLPHR